MDKIRNKKPKEKEETITKGILKHMREARNMDVKEFQSVTKVKFTRKENISVESSASM